MPFFDLILSITHVYLSISANFCICKNCKILNLIIYTNQKTLFDIFAGLSAGLSVLGLES